MIEIIQQKLAQKKPGYQAHKLMMPEGRAMNPVHNANPTQSAVLIALFNEKNLIKFPLIRRPKYNGSHSGQMALPGGKFEPNDISLKNTAIRESYEEIGIQPENVEIIGSLSELYIQVTNIQVTPYVGIINTKPYFKIDKREVDELYIADLSEIQNPNNKFKENWNIQGTNIDVPYYKLQDQIVWGATAMILSEFEQLIK